MKHNAAVTFFLCLALLCSCGKAPRPVNVVGHPLSEPQPVSVTAESLAHRPIDDLLVLVFRDGGDSLRWQQVFTDATHFSALRSRGRALAAAGVADNADEINALNGEIATVLTRLSQEETTFLLQLSESAGCTFGNVLDNTHVAVHCDEVAFYDVPKLEGVAEVVMTRRNGREISPAVRLRLHSDDESAHWGRFGLNADLVPEFNDGLLSFKGTVTVDDGSYFLSEGTLVAHYTYGFSEMILRERSPLRE